MTYKYIANKIDDDKIKYHFTVTNNNENRRDFNEINYKQFINLLKSENKDFLEIFISALKNAKTELNSAFFWECLPISKETTKRTFEFVVTKSASLENSNQDYSSFQDHITENTDPHVLSFLNYSEDAILIVPTPLPGKDYKNISKFTENAPIEQQQKLWKEVVEKLSEKLEQDPKVPKWLSTHGTGVYYLHVRVNDRPAYYHWQEYKKFKKMKKKRHRCQFQTKNNLQTKITSFREPK